MGTNNCPSVKSGKAFIIFKKVGEVILRISIFTLLEEIENERGYPEIKILFPLNSSDRLRGEVEKDTVDTLYLVGDAVGNMMEEGIGNLLDSSRHSVGSVYGSDDCRPAFVTAFVFYTYALDIGNDNKILPNLAFKSVLCKFFAENSVCLSECVETVTGDCAETSYAKSGTREGLTVNHCVRKTECLSNNSYLVLEEKLDGLNELKL